MLKSDYIGSAIIGFIISLLFLIISYTTITVIRPDEPPPRYYWAALVVLPILSFAGIFLLSALREQLGERLRVVLQFYRFVLVGVFNTLLDLAVLNGLIVLTATATGTHFSLFKAVSFAVAVANSYIWNKFWTFRKKKGGGIAEFGQFIAVSLVGLGVNVAAASLVVNAIEPPGGLPPQLWANVGAMVAIGFSTIWNFIGYKFVVFRSEERVSVNGVSHRSPHDPESSSP